MTYQFLCYDPRDAMQARHQQTTWKPTDNPALLAASTCHMFILADLAQATLP